MPRRHLFEASVVSALLFVLICLFQHDAESRIRGSDRGAGRSAGGGSPSLDQAATWTPLDIDNVILSIDAAHTEHLWKESGYASIPDTRATSVNDYVGQLDDASPRAHIVQAFSDAQRPQLLLDGPVPYLDFPGSGNVRLYAFNSKRAFKSFTGGTTTGTIFLRAKIGSDASTEYLIGNSASTAHVGLNVYRAATNKVVFYSTFGSAGNYVFNYTTTATWTTSDEWVDIVVRLNGAGTSRIEVNGTEETFSRSNTGTTADASYDLMIGARGDQAGSTEADVGIQFLVMTDDYMSDADVALLKAYTQPNLTSRSLVKAVDASEGYYNFLAGWYDFTDASTLWQETSGARTTQVASLNDPIGEVAHKLDISNPTWSKREGLSGATGERPLWKQSSGALFDGVDDAFAMVEHISGLGGAKTLFCVLRNKDHTYGSRPIGYPGSGYWVVTGDNYVSNPGGAAYMTYHPAGGAAPSASSLLSETGYNIVEVTRDAGSAWTTGVQGQNEASGTNSYLTKIEGIGYGYDADWFMDGELVEILVYSAKLTASQMARVRAGLVAKHSGILP